MYFTIIYSIKKMQLPDITTFQYGLCSWGFHSDGLFALHQKPAVRVVANRPYIAHTDPIFNKYTLTFKYIYTANYFIAYVIIFYHYTLIPFFQL